jgi:hypothetical protein
MSSTCRTPWPPLDDWYDDVFFPRRGVMDGNHAPSLKRDASLLVIADIIIEPMAPSQLEGAEGAARVLPATGQRPVRARGHHAARSATVPRLVE